MPKKSPLLRVLAAVGVAWEQLKRQLVFEVDAASAVGIPCDLHNLHGSIAMIIEPPTLNGIENRILLVPVKILDRGRLVCGAK